MALGLESASLSPHRYDSVSDSGHNAGHNKMKVSKTDSKSSANASSQGTVDDSVEGDELDEPDSSNGTDDNEDGHEEAGHMAPSGEDSVDGADAADAVSDSLTDADVDAGQTHNLQMGPKIGEIGVENASQMSYDDDDYKGLDAISNADATDIDELERYEEEEMERLIIAEEEEAERIGRLSRRTSVSSGASDIPDLSMLTGDDFFGAAMGSDIDCFTGFDFVDAADVPDAPRRRRQVSDASAKRVRFKDQTTSESSSDSEVSISEVFKDIYVPQDVFDRNFAREFEADEGGSPSDGSSCWDLEGEEEVDSNAGALDVPVDFTASVMPFPDFLTFPEPTVPIVPFCRQKDVEGGSSGYDSEDGNTTDDEIPVLIKPKKPKFLRHRRTPSMRSSTTRSLPKTPITKPPARRGMSGRRGKGPVLGRFLASKTRAAVWIDRRGLNTVKAGVFKVEPHPVTDSEPSTTVHNSPQVSLMSEDIDLLQQSMFPGPMDIMMSG
ncbi:hypothetical protein LTS18_008697, partial [Coniosporium uncinatum]